MAGSTKDTIKAGSSGVPSAQMAEGHMFTSTMKITVENAAGLAGMKLILF